MERRLAAILAADVVGYSRLMGADEEGTLHALKAHLKDVADPAFVSHRGRLVKTTGDGMLVEFASAVDAVRCAVDVQRGMAERNEPVPLDQRIEFRIGINVGDIIGDGDDIYGDGVNVAARLEAMAPPGGICVSRAVRDPVRDKLAFGFDDLGEVQAKNIARPIHVFLLRHDSRTDTPAPVVRRPRRVGALVVAVVATFAVLGTTAELWFVFGRGAPSTSTASVVTSTEKPSIAVLPFTNLSGDPAQEYFSDGVSEEILTALARSPYLTVIARNSSFTFKNRAVNVIEAGKTLGVHYLLEGSVQRSTDQVRVTAQLIDAVTGAHVWAERYDRPLKDIFAVQDEITGIIAARLDANIQKAEVAEIRRRLTAAPTVSLTAYELFLRGRPMERSSIRPQQLRARALFEKAIEIDPNFALAYANLANTYYSSIAVRWNDMPREEALAKGLELAGRALELDPALPVANLVMGDLLLRRHDYAEAIVWARKAIALNPNDPEGYAGLANILTFVNRAAEALPLMEQAVRLDPLYPPVYDMYIGRARLISGDSVRSIAPLRDCAQRVPAFWPCHAYLASGLAQIGQDGPARAELAEMQKYYPVKSVAAYRASSDFQPGPQTEIIYAGLEKAGLPRD